MGTVDPPAEPQLSPNPADADSPPLLVESVIPLQAPETVLAPPVHQAEFFAQALLEGLEPPTRKQVFKLINMLDFKDGSRKGRRCRLVLFAWWLSTWWRLRHHGERTTFSLHHQSAHCISSFSPAKSFVLFHCGAFQLAHCYASGFQQCRLS